MKNGEKIQRIDKYDGGPHEANFLKIDCSKLKRYLNWNSLWSIGAALEKAIGLYLILFG